VGPAADQEAGPTIYAESRPCQNYPDARCLPALAEGILALDFPEGDAARIEELNVRANEGELTDEEEAELEAYANINDLLAYWQSKDPSEVTAARISGPSEAVRQRARNRCEYRRLPQAAFRRGFHIEHIVARQHGGPISLNNLALACWSCNLKEGSNLHTVHLSRGAGCQACRAESHLRAPKGQITSGGRTHSNS